jgi:hypothetical protein
MLIDQYNVYQENLLRLPIIYKNNIIKKKRRYTFKVIIYTSSITLSSYQFPISTWALNGRTLARLFIDFFVRLYKWKMSGYKIQSFYCSYNVSMSPASCQVEKWRSVNPLFFCLQHRTSNVFLLNFISFHIKFHFS